MRKHSVARHCAEQLFRAVAGACAYPAVLGRSLLSFRVPGDLDRAAWARSRRGFGAPLEGAPESLGHSFHCRWLQRSECYRYSPRARDRPARAGVAPTEHGELSSFNRGLHVLGRAILSYRTSVLSHLRARILPHSQALRRRPLGWSAGLFGDRATAQLDRWTERDFVRGIDLRDRSGRLESFSRRAQRSPRARWNSGRADRSESLRPSD